MPALSKYNPEYHDDWAWSLAIKGATNDEIAEAFGISTRTFIRWKQEHESLNDAVERGKNIADSKVEKALYQRALGYQITDTEKTIDMDKDGNPEARPHQEHDEEHSARHYGNYVLAEQPQAYPVGAAAGSRPLRRR